MKKNSGFTMTELLIVLVVAAILAIVSVPIYKGQVLRSYTMEGQALLQEFAAAQEIFADRYGRFWKDGTNTSELLKGDATNGWEAEELGVNTKRNRYFKNIEYVFKKNPTTGGTDTGEGFVITAKGQGKAKDIVMVLTWYFEKEAVITAKKDDKLIKGFN